MVSPVHLPARCNCLRCKLQMLVSVQMFTFSNMCIQAAQLHPKRSQACALKQLCYVAHQGRRCEVMASIYQIQSLLAAIHVTCCDIHATRKSLFWTTSDCRNQACVSCCNQKEVLPWADTTIQLSMATTALAQSTDSEPLTCHLQGWCISFHRATTSLCLVPISRVQSSSP